MKLRWFRVPFDDCFQYDLNIVYLNHEGIVSAWHPTPVVTLDTMGDEAFFKESMKDDELADAIRKENGFYDMTNDELREAVRDAHMDYERNGCIDFELEMRMWGE